MSIIDDSGNINTGGNLSVTGNLTQSSSTTTTYSDGLLELNNGVDQIQMIWTCYGKRFYR